MTFRDALYELGVRDDTLTDEEKEQLDRDGFLPLKNILTPEQAYQMRVAMTELFVRENTGQEGAPSECSQMQNKAAVYDICFTHPRVVAAIAHVLKEDATEQGASRPEKEGEFISLGIHSRPNPPGRGHQALHVDYGGPPAKPGEYFTCNSMWPLVDFTVENGATRAVPGSHRWEKHPGDLLADPHVAHPDEVYFVAPLGTVIIFNSHVWHGARLNGSQADRPNVTSFWTRRVQPDGSVRKNHLSMEAYRRLSPAARRLFDPPPESAESGSQ